ncbi:caspase family protein [Actinoplanes sp. Pm04-4]|uniref:Caspase family protein n=1 Tax=Paractinoplanes pyxinae TaxID=2997416 RepID=A0ABT4B4Y9_9ACTN|nr:caspase family protein [Actinoplanes pyxinae]MCY1141561.1 caspase family protein [Actinoplanes pyxinae]
MSDFDLGRSRAVLIGSWSFTSTDLPDVPAARCSLEAMRATLESDLCGWPADSLTVVSNPERPADLPDQLMRTFAEAADVALFYFVGHGQVDEEDQLCLCTRNSVTESPRRSTTSLPYDVVRRALQRSPARVKIVVLDCCYSGIATEQSNSLSGSATDLAVRARSNGVYTVAASGPYGTAWFEPEGTTDDPPMTYFTKYFTQIVRDGIADEPSLLRLNPIYLEVHARLVADGKPAPTRRASDTADEFPFARNASPAVRPTGSGRLELETLLAAREKELEGSRIEQKQLAEQLAEIRSFLETARHQPAVASHSGLANIEQEVGALVGELREARDRVRRDEQRVDELSQTSNPAGVADQTKSLDKPLAPVELIPIGETQPGPPRPRIHISTMRWLAALCGTAFLIASAVLIGNGQFDRGATGRTDSITSLSPTTQSDSRAPNVATSRPSATNFDSGETSYLYAPSAPFTAESPWRLQVTGSACSVYLLNSQGDEIGTVYSRSEQSATHWLQVRTSGTFRYQIAKDFECNARRVAGAGRASLPAKISRSSSDSLGITDTRQLHVVATPAEDQCDVAVRDSSDGKALIEKIGNPGEVLTFNFNTGGKDVYLSAGVTNCTVTVSAAK